jgi:hypothetical protein
MKSLEDRVPIELPRGYLRVWEGFRVVYSFERNGVVVLWFWSPRSFQLLDMISRKTIHSVWSSGQRVSTM